MIISRSKIQDDENMKRNVGTADRVIRVILELVIIALRIAFKSWLAIFDQSIRLHLLWFSV